MLCSECKNRDLCTSLCAEAELIADQDYVPQYEETIGLPTPRPFPKLKSNIHLTQKEKEIVTLLGKGLSRTDVCQLLDMSRVTLRNHISRMKRKYKE